MRRVAIALSLALLPISATMAQIGNPAGMAPDTRFEAPFFLIQALILKITATLPFADIALADNLLSEARDIGCRIAIDDYGCGYAIYLCLWGVKAHQDRCVFCP